MAMKSSCTMALSTREICDKLPFASKNGVSRGLLGGHRAERLYSDTTVWNLYPLLRSPGSGHEGLRMG